MPAVGSINVKSKLWLPSLADIIFVCPFIFLTFNAGNMLLNDGDTGFHIRAGDYIIENLTVPKYDIFSYIVPPLPWVAHEWLSEVIMALIHKFSGMTGIVIFFSFLISLVFFLLFKYSQSLNYNIVVATFLVLLATFSSSIHWLARPHVFSLLLTVIWYGVLNTYQYKGTNFLYLLPPLMLLWVNLHGGFILGFLLLGIYLGGNVLFCYLPKNKDRDSAGEKSIKLAVITAICLFVSMINPQSYSILFFPFKMVSNQFLMENVNEFLSPNFHHFLPYKYFLLFTIAILSLSRRSLDVIEFTLVLLFTYMSLYSARYIPLFVIILTPIALKLTHGLLETLNNGAARMFREQSKNLEIVNARAKGHLWPILFIVWVFALALNGKLEFEFDPTKKPVAAVEFLKREQLDGKMFNDDEFGDYIIYAASPQYKVFFDGRSDMYGEKWGSQYVKIVNMKPGWENVIEKNDFEWIFYHAGSPLSMNLLASKKWHLIYADRVAYIMVKTIPKNQFIIDKYPDIKPVNLDEHESK